MRIHLDHAHTLKRNVSRVALTSVDEPLHALTWAKYRWLALVDVDLCGRLADFLRTGQGAPCWVSGHRRRACRLLERGGYRLELRQRRGEVLDDLPGDDLGRRQVVEVVEGVVACSQVMSRLALSRATSSS